MTIQNATLTGQIPSEPVSLLHHTHSNADGIVSTYYAMPDFSGIKPSPYTFDVAATLAGAFYSTAWETGYIMGVVL